MNKLLSVFNSRLWIKVLIPVFFCVLLVMATSLWISIRTQNRIGQEQISSQNGTLARAIEGGMFDALAIGDNDTVRTQFRRLSEEVKSVRVFVYDFNRIVSFSTQVSSVGKKIDDYTSDLALEDIEKIIASGKETGASFHIPVGEKDFIIKSMPILNEPRCFHCHGQRHKILGGISVLSSMEQVQAGIHQGKTTSIWVSAAGLCLIVAFIWLIFTFLVNAKVRRVFSMATRLREKDFTRDTPVKNGDEINHILNRLNVVSREWRETLKEIVADSGKLDQSSGQMSRIAETLIESSAQTSQKASNVSAAAEEMNINNQGIASSMDDASDNLNAIAASVDEMTATVGEIAKNASESKSVISMLVKSFEEILKAVENLGVRAADVDGVTDQIRSISEQVSLLALNAKIEAARAGEAGKGFAVVAQEITELAMDAGQSTQEVDEKLAGIKRTVADLTSQVSGLSQNISASENAMTGIAAAVEEQNATTSEISRNINEVSNKISDVNHRVTEGAKVASEIAREIVIVEDMSAKVQDESDHLNQDARSLARMAEKFSDLMKQFKI